MIAGGVARGAALPRAMRPDGSRASLFAAVAIAIGLALRIVGLVNRPSLSLDEARLALNIATRSYAGLASALGHDQSAPLLFLWLERTVVNVFGVSDLALRIVPLIAGIALLLLMYPTFRSIVGAPGAAFATVLVACMPTLVYYSTGVKQYGIEIFVTVLLVKLTWEWLDHTRVTSAGPLLAVGVVAPWLSAPAVFVVGGVVLAVGAASRSRDDARSVRLLRWAIPLWGCSAAAAYLLTYRVAAHNPYLQHYWRPAFLSWEGGRLWASLAGLGRETFWGVTIGYPGALGGRSVEHVLPMIGVLFGVVSALGVWGLVRRAGLAGACLILAPVAAAFAASLLGFYPIVFRLMLFALPLVLLLLMVGVAEMMARFAPTVQRVVWGTAGVFVAFPLLAVALLESTSVNPPEHLRPLVGEWRRLRRPGEPIYLFTGSIPSWAFYSTEWAAPDQARLAAVERWASSGGAAFENAPSRERPVGQEGQELFYDTPTGRELYGLATGIEWQPIYGPLRRTTDLGWAEHEAERIRAAAAPSVWVVMSHTVGDEADLFRRLDRLGGRPVYRRTLNDALLVRYTFAALPD